MVNERLIVKRSADKDNTEYVLSSWRLIDQQQKNKGDDDDICVREVQISF